MKLNYTVAFKCLEVTPSYIKVITSDKQELKFPNKYPQADVGDKGFLLVSNYGITEKMPVTTLSFMKDTKYCPVCSGIGFIPGTYSKCGFCDGKIIVDSLKYYEYFLSRSQS